MATGSEGRCEEPGSSAGSRPMCRSDRPEHASCHPSTSISTTSPRDASGARPTGHATSREPSVSRRAERVWCETPRCRSLESAVEYRTAMTALPPRAAVAFAASATERPPWPNADPVPTMPGPIAQTTASNPLAFAHASADPTLRACTSPSRHGETAIALSSSPLVFSVRTVSENATGRAPPASCANATRTPVPIPATTGATWLWRAQHTTGIPPRSSASPSFSSTHAAAD